MLRPDPDLGGIRLILTPPRRPYAGCCTGGPARCHPDRQSHGRRLCHSCYARAYRWWGHALGPVVTPADMVILVPMLGRPHHVRPLLASIDDTAPAARVLFLLSSHDRTVIREVAAAGREHITVPRRLRGDYAHKINTGYEATAEPLIFTGASDLKFHPGWFEAAAAQLAPGVGVVGTNDLGSPRVLAGEHATHCLVTRWYADQFGTIDQPGAILHEGYWHEWVDDELVGTAKARGAWAFAADSHVEHLHPNWHRDVPLDDIYRQQPRRIAAGRPLFQRRRRLWT